jgi:serine protease
MQYAYKKNVTLICSAGNEGKEGVGFPGKLKECIAVSAVGPGGMMASYSTWGKEVDIAGPGGEGKMGEDAEVWQNTIGQRQGFFGPSGPKVDGFFPKQGTSMAAPHVTGVAALLVSLGMTDPKEIRSQLRKSAKPYAPADHYGAGILDAAKAVQAVQRSTKTNSNQLWLALGVGALLFAIRNSLQRKTDPMFFVHQVAIALAVGMFFPVVLESIVGFGSWWNLVGHSVIVPVIFFQTTPKIDRTGFWRACAFTLGIVIHLLLDADSGRAPFQVLPQQRILFWMYANAAVGLYFAASSYVAMRKRDQVPAEAAVPA